MIIDVREIMGNSASVDDLNRKRYTRKFRVQSDWVNEAASTVRQAPGLPALYDAFTGPNANSITGDDDSICVSIEAHQDDNPYIWLVTCSFASVTVVPTIRMTLQDDQRPAVRDVYGRAVVNSARNQFDPPHMMPWNRGILTIQRAEQSIDYPTLHALANTTNSDAWLGFDPGVAKAVTPQAESFYESGRFGWRVTYEFHLRKEGWREPIMDRGYRRLDADGKEREIFDVSGHLSSSPTLLNGKGGLLRDTFTKLDSGVDAVTNYLNVTTDPATVFPAVSDDLLLYLKLEDEVMKVVSYGPGNVVYVERGAVGTVAASHSAAGSPKVTLEPVFLMFDFFLPTAYGPLGLP